MIESIRYNLANLRNFEGRDSKALLWPYVVGVVYLLGFLSIVSMMPTVLAVMGMFDANLAWPLSSLGFLATLAIAAFLLAACVKRRLNDGDRSPYWAAPPVILFAISAILMPRVFGGIAAGADDMSLFSTVFMINMGYIVSLAPLAYFLNADGDYDTNRHGPPPGH